MNFSGKSLLIFFSFILCASLYFSCTKDQSVEVYVPTTEDSISAIIDSVVGSYRVFVTKDSLFFGFYVDTIGFDTIEVLRKGNDSISILNYTLSIGAYQKLNDSDFYFEFSDYVQFPPIEGTAHFYPINDSIDFRSGYGGWEWGTYYNYRGIIIK